MLRNTLFAALAFGLMVAAPASADGINTDPAKVTRGAYTVEPSHTRVLFAVNHLGFTTWYGEFTKTTGTLDLDDKAPKLDVTIDTGSVSTSNAKLDGELKSADWFAAEKFPQIHFVSTKVVHTGKDTADVTGNLTFRGVTKPVTLKAKFNASGINVVDKHYTVGFEVSGTIKRSEFGVMPYIPAVGDDVKLIISAAFEKA
ncbi:MAG: YceI family protein [Rhizomicrobium sp.]